MRGGEGPGQIQLLYLPLGTGLECRPPQHDRAEESRGSPLLTYFCPTTSEGKEGELRPLVQGTGHVYQRGVWVPI